jgi:esterase
VFLNEFAPSLVPVDMTATVEFASLLASAAELQIPHDPAARYLSRQTVVRGMRFHFLEWGNPAAPPLVLLHGGNQSAHSWDLTSLHLSDRFHVYALDQRGHGDSEWNKEVDYSTEAKAQDAAAFIEDQGLEQPIIVGHSMGGFVAMTMLLANPALARALVLVDVGPELSTAGTRVVHDFVVHNIEFDDLDVFIDNVARYDRFRPREHIARTVKYNMLQRADGKYVSKVDHRRASGGPPRTIALDDVAALTLPVLLIRGADSEVLEADAAERFVAALPDGALVTVADAGHNVHGANTPGFLAVLLPFLTKVVD